MAPEFGYGPLDDDPRLEPVDRYEISGMLRPFKGTPVEDKLRVIAADAHADEIPWTLFEDFYERMRKKYLPPYRQWPGPNISDPISCEHADSTGTVWVYHHSPRPHRCDQENHFDQCPWWESNGRLWSRQQQRRFEYRARDEVGQSERAPLIDPTPVPEPRPFYEQQTEKFLADTASFAGEATFLAAVRFVEAYGMAVDHMRDYFGTSLEWRVGMVGWIARRLNEERRLRWGRWDLTLAAEAMGWDSEEQPDLTRMSEQENAEAIALMEPFLLKLFEQNSILYADAEE